MSVTKVTDAMRNVTQVDAAKITTGTIPDARIQASAVTAHVDLTAVRQDIAMLALYNAVSDNRAAYNLPFSFIDQFEDDTGLTTQTNVDRDTSEYISSSVTTEGTPTQLTLTSGMFSINSELDPTGNIYKLVDGSTSAYAVYGIQTTLSSANGILTVDYGSAVTWKYFRWYNFRTNGRMKEHKIQTSTDNATWTDQTTTLSETTTSSSSILHDATSADGWNRNTLDTPTSARYIRIVYSSGYNEGDTACGVAEIQAYQQVTSTTVNATGTLISDTQTSSVATTKMSGVILYKDNAGTATLGTDLVISLSADNGSNWTEAASYGTVTPLFSTGVKMVRLGETTVTSGIAPVIKAVWANQAASSKETQLHGWAMNY